MAVAAAVDRPKRSHRVALVGYRAEYKLTDKHKTGARAQYQPLALEVWGVLLSTPLA